VARQAADEAGLGAECRNPYRSILVRAVEVVYAVDETLRLIERYEPPAPCHLDVPPRAATGHGATEAPRGVVFHRCAIDAEGLITSAGSCRPPRRIRPASKTICAGSSPVGWISTVSS
jgi:sulfhydrogenase subunit alpha